MGTPGHMAHPFDVDRVKTGQDLIDYINDAVLRLQNQEIAGSVKWDGINTSFKLITTDDGRKEFRMDRGTSEIGSVVGFDAESALKKWGTEHGMTQAIVKLLEIFNKALPFIRPELKELGMWDDPTKYFNTEYIEGKSNVQEYAANILAIHGINQFYEKKAQAHRIRKGTSMDRPGLARPVDHSTGKPIKGGGIEVPYDKEALGSLIEKVQPIAAKAGFEVYGDVPVEFDPEMELDLDKVLDIPVSVQITPGGVATNSLREWLQMVEHPKDKRITRSDGRSVGALSKDIYMAVLRSAEEGGIPLSQYLESKDDVKDAINGGIFYHGTRLLGQAVKNALTSQAGSVGAHEGVVLRGLEDFLVKLTGDFIVQGLASTHGNREDRLKEEWAPLDKDWRRNYGREDSSGYTPHGRSSGKGKHIALYPGKFKPPHAGHFDVAKEMLHKPNVDKLIIFISPRPHEGIGPDQAKAIWEIYKPYLPGDVEIRIGNITPVRSVYEYLDNEAEEGDVLNLVLGEKDISDGRYAVASSRRSDIGVNVLPVPPQAGGISATQMRLALTADDEEAARILEKTGKTPEELFVDGLPSSLKDQEISDILTLLGKKELEEVSAMGGGAVAGAPGPFGQPLRRGRKKKDDRLVNEVMDYLLGISVG
tara:strand:- start:4823 stop:6769 length:1947 start_codon:yes stop_codon:yes gene_type:complete